MAARLDPATATNYQLLVDSGDRTWSQIADMADREQSPDLAEYARERAAVELPLAPVAPRPAAEKPAPDPGR